MELKLDCKYCDREKVVNMCNISYSKIKDVQEVMFTVDRTRARSLRAR
ncbi:MAG: hypothetical protein ACRDBM_12610 [Sporomusa sp.]